jgi:hypothetical protein
MPQPLIQRLGFEVPDRKPRKHDDIRLWVYDNFPTILESVFPCCKLTIALNWN